MAAKVKLSELHDIYYGTDAERQATEATTGSVFNVVEDVEGVQTITSVWEYAKGIGWCKQQ